MNCLGSRKISHIIFIQQLYVRTDFYVKNLEKEKNYIEIRKYSKWTKNSESLAETT